ncbi:hypothetical protein F5Y13DRAFT_175692 [Hypoxylon sp. FL1857]|nr:hypothetical protein F5Y13DRAFT_175692 [Hypoxylon sp. FL1857]
MASNPSKPKVYRLRGCPIHLDRLGATELLSGVLGDVRPHDIRIQSLATSLDPWARSPTKVGTLMFRKQPALVETRIGKSEWTFPVVGLEKPLVLDDHFLGMTPLNDVERERHEFNCIAISGLASHPFGSWQPKGGDKSFMWIRDELPRAMPDTRLSIYGYDTALVGSNSFQSIEDLATSLIDHIKSSGWALPSAKPLIFLAHSLGGIVLKEAFVSLASGHEQGMHILNLFKGGIFFGVPSQGMATSHLRAMVEGQVNEELIRDLSIGSEYLRSLDDHFSGLSLVRHMCIHWAYETKTSPTVMKNSDGSFTRTGPEEILVSKESATRSLYSSRSSAIFPINKNHSEMVKLLEDDANARVIVDKLQESCRRGIREVDADIGVVSREVRHVLGSPATTPWTGPSHRDGIPEHSAFPNIECTIGDLMESLEYPDLNYRLETIDANFEHTCEWVFYVKQGSLSRWLKNGDGFFWIHGKPGSGKSTLMKFIIQHQRTWELLHRFPSDALQISASFFFHDRGSLLQHSFEGLLRSVLYQIIGKLQRSGADISELSKPLLDIYAPLSGEQSRNWTIGELESCISVLLRQTSVELDIFLLLDALDEYDGGPDFICGILKEMMNMTANSRTRLKILFSSRPWETFERQFAAAPSIQVQDFTKGDIETYCWGIIDSREEEISVALGRIIPAVINRADGVFLWVRLVLLELANEALQGNDVDELARILNSIPSDLQEYYARTVQRIPEKLRWDAYVILEVLSTDLQPGHVVSESSFDMVMAALECSKHSTYKGCHRSLRLDSPPRANKSESNMPIQSDQAPGIDISTATGNLAELVRVGRQYGDLAIQFAHQTVKEFVLSQDFKRFMLGHKARQTLENGYTFIAKYLLTDKRSDEAVDYLRQHEMTTGCSLKDFLDSIPKKYFNQAEGRFDGPLAYAMYGNLQLYLEETLRRDPNAFRKTQERLLSICPYFIEHQSLGDPVPFQKQATLRRFVLEHGYTVKQDPQAFEGFMRQQDSCFFGVWAEDAGNPKVRYLWAASNAAMLITYGQDPNIWINIYRGTKMPFRLARQKKKALHLTKTAALANCLLQHGTPVNELDSVGNTPLDCIVQYWSTEHQLFRGEKENWRLLIYQTARLLVEYGGITKIATREVWEECLSDFQENGLEVTPLRECLDRIQFKKNIRERAMYLIARLWP